MQMKATPRSSGAGIPAASADLLLQPRLSTWRLIREGMELYGLKPLLFGFLVTGS